MRHILGIPKYQCQGIPNFNYVRLAYMETWNKRLAIARTAAMKSKTDVARAVGVSNATVSDWESGEIKKIEAENLLKVCDFLNVSPSWLQFGRGEMLHIELSEDDLHALKINRMLGTKEKRAWYRAGDSLAEPEEDAGGAQ